IGPGAVDICEFTCDQVYAGQVQPGGCSDCGPGYWQTIMPGATADLPWDRLVYVRHTVEPPCATATGTCALGVPVAPSTAQSGTLTACATQGPTTGCAQQNVVTFTIDPTANAGPIELLERRS